MQARMTNPALLNPDTLKALQALGASVANAGIPPRTLELVHLRASQINGCSVCVDMHAHALKKGGESDQRIFAVGAWREAPWFTDAERAALALTEALTRLSDTSDAVPDTLWQEATRHFDERALGALVVAIAQINLWNRLNVATRQVAGAFR
ncbi:carboxymuconolactone decarboxylase family protein [Myxococcus stipitatus]|uniref:carboxymuconolactone decarboxylase family protein n=1 Tax=Myxococcus stipitatus TaxID=83455 RepID=UPI001F2A1136|nr:carboxymuconolactone decarboxylase family protein [Myxococcus stipitatus]MCE9669793.1 carboxymuconolactone decarboxylase family protein [Myxococcus stipitatus]